MTLHVCVYVCACTYVWPSFHSQYMCHVFYYILPEINCSPFTVGREVLSFSQRKEEGSMEERVGEGGTEGKGVAFCR